MTHYVNEYIAYFLTVNYKASFHFQNRPFHDNSTLADIFNIIQLYIHAIIMNILH